MGAAEVISFEEVRARKVAQWCIYDTHMQATR
jgi:hypothetical protein